MTARRKLSPPEEKPLQLLVPATELRERIAGRIGKGKEILQTPIQSAEALEAARNGYHTWSEYNQEMLRRTATNDELSREYSWCPEWSSQKLNPSLWDEIEALCQAVREEIRRLESISGRLELIPVAEDVRPQTRSVVSPPAAGGPIFVVHGHDGEARETVARFIEKLGFKPVILHEQANEGRTVIEKLEAHSDVGFAVVLLTPDDEGRKVGSPQPLRSRARQNVVLELGFFVGRLGRKNVCALHRGNLEMPTDYVGVVYVPLDEGGAWQIRLAKELRAAGYQLDMNLVV